MDPGFFGYRSSLPGPLVPAFTTRGGGVCPSCRNEATSQEVTGQVLKCLALLVLIAPYVTHSQPNITAIHEKAVERTCRLQFVGYN